MESIQGPKSRPKFYSTQVKHGSIVSAQEIEVEEVGQTPHGSRCRHSILYPWFNQGEWLEWSFMYPKNHDHITCIDLFLHYIHQFVLALHASIHSWHIIKMNLRF